MRKKPPTPADVAAIPSVPVRIADIEPHPENPRTHPAAQVSAIGASYREFSQVWPILLDRKGKRLRLIAGEGRWQAARAEGRDVVYAIVVDWPEERIKRFMVADNRIPQLGGFDPEIYREVLLDIGAGSDLLALGFDQVSFEAATVEIEAPATFSEVDESIPTEHQCPRCGYRWSGGADTPAKDEKARGKKKAKQ